MTDTKQLAGLLREAAEYCHPTWGDKLEAAAAELEAREPVAWMYPSEGGYDSQFRDHSTVVLCTGNKWEGWVPLYTTPPAPQVPDVITRYDDIYRAAEDKWGIEVQARVAMGECGELIAALVRYYTQGRGSIEDVIDELADVRIMVDQLELAIGRRDVSRRRVQKMEKLRQIIEGELSHPHAAPQVPDELRWRILAEEKPENGQWCLTTRTIADALRAGCWDEATGRFYPDDPSGAKYWKPAAHIPESFNGESLRGTRKLQAALAAAQQPEGGE